MSFDFVQFGFFVVFWNSKKSLSIFDNAVTNVRLIYLLGLIFLRLETVREKKSRYTFMYSENIVAAHCDR